MNDPLRPKRGTNGANECQEGFDLARDETMSFLDSFKVPVADALNDREKLVCVARTSLRTKEIDSRTLHPLCAVRLVSPKRGAGAGVGIGMGWGGRIPFVDNKSNINMFKILQLSIRIKFESLSLFN